MWPPRSGSSGRAPRPAGMRTVHRELPVDRHRSEEQCEIEQRELVHRPGGGRANRSRAGRGPNADEQIASSTTTATTIDAVRTRRTPPAGESARTGSRCTRPSGRSSALTPDQRRHRDARPSVVALLEQRERPEMRRRPVEDDEEQIHGDEIQPAGDGGLAHQRRERARGAADHNVLRACCA